MKALSKLFAIMVVAALTALPATAQHAQHHPEQTADRSAPQGQQAMMQGMHGGAMMQGDMHSHMKGMMQQPQMRAMMLTHALPVMQDTLGLNDDQVARLHELQKAFETKRDTRHEAMQASRQQLQELDLDDERTGAALKEAAEQRTEMHLAALETAQAMRDVLTDQQREHLDAMAPMALHRRAMASASMQAMMQTMRDGSMGCPMMSMMSGDMMGSMKGGMQQQMQN